MIDCRGCGHALHETATVCPHCGAPQPVLPVLPMLPVLPVLPMARDTLPDGVKGWCWGGFLLSWLWGPFNGTWIALLALVPGLGFIVGIVLGIKGREWAWKNRRWNSVAHFNRVQRAWSIWGVVVIATPIVVGIVLAFVWPGDDETDEHPARNGASRVSIDPPACATMASITPPGSDRGSACAMGSSGIGFAHGKAAAVATHTGGPGHPSIASVAIGTSAGSVRSR